jgi:YbbR domain-containing protein
MKSVKTNSYFSQKSHRKIKVFFIVFILTSIIWLLIELSKTYTSTVQFSVNYENIPSTKLLQKTPVNEINVIIKAPGFSILSHRIRKRKISFDLNDMVMNKSVYFLIPNAQLSKINAQFSSDLEIMNVLKDSIFLDIGNRISKRVPVIPNLELNYNLGFNLVEKFNLSPDSVDVTGPEKLIDTIHSVTTKRLVLNNINADINEKLTVIYPTSNINLTISAKSVLIKGVVDKFTEGSFSLPVTIINEPEGVTINPFPKEIEVTYQVGVSNFNKIDPSSITIIFDYQQYKNDTLIKFLTPKVIKKSEFISSIKMNPSQIEFLIQK